MNGCREGGKWGRRSCWLTHSPVIGFSTLIRRVGGGIFLLSSRYFVVLKYFLVPVEFGGGGGMLMRCVPRRNRPNYGQ
jgi:hypothetical protein